MKAQPTTQTESPKMTANVILRSLQTIHRRMGYPLGKIHYKIQGIRQQLKESGSPTRYVRGIVYRIINLREGVTRRIRAGTLTKNLNPAIVGHVKELGEEGFSYFTEQIDPKLMQELNTYYDEVISKRSATATSYESHPFFFPLIRQEDLTTDNILVRFALQDSITQALTAHFGSVPYLSGIYVTESRSVETVGLLGSQQWHLDYSWWNSDQVFLWVYLTDVNSLDQGPFTFIPIPGSRKVKNDFFPRRIQDEEIEAAGLTSQIKNAFGARSTAFFINSYKCYHMGSRLAKGEKRVAYMISYTKPAKEQNLIKITTPVPEHKKLLVSR